MYSCFMLMLILLMLLFMFTFVELMFGFCLRVYVSRGSYFVYVFKKKFIHISAKYFNKRMRL